MSVSRINQNVMAMGAYRNLSVAQNSLNNNVRHFSTGLRIESAKDDATGLAISERFRAQITGYETANKNAQDGDNLLQVADGSLNETHATLQRLRQLALTCANEATTDDDRVNIQTEVDQLLEEIDSKARTTQYNGRILLDGTMKASKSQVDGVAVVTQSAYINATSAQTSSGTELVTVTTNSTTYSSNDFTIEVKVVAGGATGFSIQYTTSIDPSSTVTVGATNAFTVEGFVFTTATGAVSADLGKTAYIRVKAMDAATLTDTSTSFQVGANQGQVVRVGLEDATTKGLRIQDLDMSTRMAGQNAIKALDEAIQRVSTQRAKIGALQQRIGSKIASNELNILNQRAAESRIRDVDFAQETLSFTRNNILIQSGTAVLAQANAAPQGVLSLLR